MLSVSWLIVCGHSLPASLPPFLPLPFPPSFPPSRGGKVILFVDTKAAAADYTQNLQSIGAKELHGDIAQSQREVRRESQGEGTV